MRYTDDAYSQIQLVRSSTFFLWLISHKSNVLSPTSAKRTLCDLSVPSFRASVTFCIFAVFTVLTHSTNSLRRHFPDSKRFGFCCEHLTQLFVWAIKYKSVKTLNLPNLRLLPDELLSLKDCSPTPVRTVCFVFLFTHLFFKLCKLLSKLVFVALLSSEYINSRCGRTMLNEWDMQKKN